MLYDIWQAFSAGRLPREVLVRALFDHSPWWGPVDAAGALQVTVDAGQRILELSASHAEGPTRAIVGDRLLELLEEPLDGLRLHLLPGVALRFDADQFGLLRTYAAALKVEAVLAGAVTEGVVATLLAHPSYWVCLEGPPNAAQISRADAGDGRRIAAVCTAPDTLDAFLQRRAGAPPEQVAELDGQGLFALLRTQDIDGFVFNPAGPLAPRAFAAALAQRCK